MKLNITNKKTIGAAALVFFMLASMFFAMGTVHAQGATTGTFNVVKSTTGGTAGQTSSISLPSSPSPIGTTVVFDIYISGANDIWGWSIPTVTWNPAVVHLTKVKEGPFLGDNAPGGDPTAMAGTGSALFDNINGLIQGGLAESIQGADQSTDASGVVATMTFTVVGFGSSAITISGGYLIATSTTTNTHIPDNGDNSGSVMVNEPLTTINLYQSGSTSNADIAWPSASNPIGGTFSVDAYISGALGNVWGWSIGVTWNPSVLSCTGITEGSYLSANGATLFAPGFIDNYIGKVDAGISDAYSTQQVDSASSGVLCTLSFTILSYGNSAIGLTAGTPGTLVNDNLPAQVITPAPTLTGATYSWTPATATGPVAAITTEGSPFGAGNSQTLTNYAITFDGTPSAPGLNTIPPAQSCPITTYSWSITLTDGVTVITATTPTVALTAAQVGMNPGTIVATLTVTAPSPTNTPAPTYTETSTTTFNLQVLPPLPAGWNNWSNGILDIWTQNGGQGLSAPATAYGPQQLVDLTALVTFNGAPVALKTVTFDIYLNGVYIDVVTAQTNANGYATTSYRLPWQDSNPTGYFGTVTITGSVDVSQVTLTDSCQFYYGYQLNLASITINNGVYDNSNPSSPIGPVFFRNYAGLNVVTLTATVTSANWTPTPFYLTATVFDANTVPVACTVLSETAPAAPNTATGMTTQTYTINLNLPTWAFVGPASVSVNILNNTPANNGLAFSPQQSASLYIYNGS